MPIRVRLQDIVEAIDLPGQEWQSFLNRDTGTIVTRANDGVVAQDEDFDPDALDDPAYVALPDSFEVHEWSMMEQFADVRPGRQREELMDAIHQRGAFRAFKSAIRRIGIEEEWYRFRQDAFERIAKDWLDANGIEYDA
jgi:hypothetical protein